MAPCCLKLHCIPDHQQELNELIHRAKDTQIYLTQLESRIIELQKQLSKIDSNLVSARQKDIKMPWVNQMASVVVKTGASIVTHQPALTPWGSIFRLFQTRRAMGSESE